MSEILEAPKKLVKGAMNLLGFETPKVPDAVANTPPPSVDSAPEPLMPTPDDAKVKAVKRRSMAEQRRRRGRASTLLTMNDDTLGG